VKTDLEYFLEAAKKWAAANRSASYMPLSLAALLEVVKLSQTLKQADLDKLPKE
jgi:hypothetical protein